MAKRSMRGAAALLACSWLCVGSSPASAEVVNTIGVSPSDSHTQIGPAYARAVLAAHPVGFWPLSERAGSLAAKAAAGNVPGKYHGTVTTNSAVDGRGVEFDGKSSYVQIPDKAAWSQTTTGVLTVEFWMRPKELRFPKEEGSGYVWILGKGEPHQQEWAFRMYGQDNRESPPRANRIAFYAFNADGGEGAGAYFQSRVSLTAWIYVVGELTPNGVRIYRNGTLEQGPPSVGTLYANPNYNISPIDGTAPLRFGTRNFHSYFAGGIADVAIYPYLLSLRQIRQHFLAGSRVRSKDTRHEAP